jgi:hypothetical protein
VNQKAGGGGDKTTLVVRAPANYFAVRRAISLIHLTRRHILIDNFPLHSSLEVKLITSLYNSSPAKLIVDTIIILLVKEFAMKAPCYTNPEP